MSPAAAPVLTGEVREAPEPRGLPFLGHVPELSWFGPLGFFERNWRRFGDTVRVRAGPRSMLVVVHPDAVERVLSTNRDNYVKGAAYDGMRLLTGQGLLTLEGDAWRQRRRLEQPSFHRASVNRFVEAMVSVTDAGLQRWRTRLPAGGTIDAQTEMMLLALEVVGETLFGQKLGDATATASGRAFTEALTLINTWMNTPLQLPLRVPTPTNVRLRRALKVLDSQTFEIIANARRAPRAEARPTLLGLLLDSKDADTGEPLSDQDLRNEVITLFLAGHETTALLLTWGLDLLGRRPAIVARMRAEVDAVLGTRLPTLEDTTRLPYLRQVIDEILRLRPPTWAIARNAVEEDVIGGFRVRPGEIVIPVDYLTHRHPDFWDEPEKFDPDRWTPERSKARHKWAYLPFSLGPRMCIGNVFSLVEATVVLAMLLQRAEFTLEDHAEVPRVSGVTMRPGRRVGVRLTWRR